MPASRPPRRYTPGSFYGLGAAGMALPLLGGCVVSGVAAALEQPRQGPTALPLALMLGVLLGTLAIYGVLWYRMWAQIQDGAPRTGPVAGSLLMFVPLLNLYWQFHGFYGLAKDMNEYCEARDLAGPRTPAWAPLTACILMLVIALLILTVVGVAVLGLLGVAAAGSAGAAAATGVVGVGVAAVAYVGAALLAIPAGVIGQIAWWFMLAQSAAIARGRVRGLRAPIGPTPPTTQGPIW